MGEVHEQRLIPRPSSVQRAWRVSRGVVVPLITLVVLLGLWEVLVILFQVPVFLLPSPSAVYAAMSAEVGSLLGHTWATFQTVALGFGVAVALGLPLAVAIGSSEAISRALYPLLVVIQSTPIIAIAPIIVVILGTGQNSRVVVTFLICFFPLVVSAARGLMATPSELRDLAQTTRMSFAQELMLVRLPYALPFLFSGLRVAITLAVIGAVVGEFVSANQGLGYRITQAMAFFHTPLAFGSVLLLALMGVSLFGLIVGIERVLFPWSGGGDRDER